MGDPYELTPYDILGVPENARMGDIHCAYRNLIRMVHPDKNFRIHRRLGWSEEDCAEAFSKIRSAYKTLLKQKKIEMKDAPMDNIDYDIDDEFIIIENYEKEKEFDLQTFNSKFEQLKKYYDEENPNAVGYNEFSRGSVAISTAGDAGDLVPPVETIIPVPEPPSAPSVCDKPKCYEFGLTNVTDFSIRSQEKGSSIEGTDLLKAFQETVPLENFRQSESLETLLEERKKERRQEIPFDDTELEKRKKKEERKQQLKWKVLEERDKKLENVSLLME